MNKTYRTKSTSEIEEENKQLLIEINKLKKIEEATIIKTVMVFIVGFITIIIFVQPIILKIISIVLLVGIVGIVGILDIWKFLTNKRKD